jgi:hypothetical protein
MDMRSREQYLESVRQEYRQASRKEKTRLLNEARRRTRLNRKVLIGKLAHPAAVKENNSRRRRGASYGPEVVTAMVKVWEIFDFPCGQRLVAVLGREVERLRKMGELRCSDAVAKKLRRISPKTVDRLLAREKQVRQLRRNRTPRMHPLLYQRVPVKVAADWDTRQVGNLQVDFVEHCGRSNGGQYLHTLSTVDIASSWWEGEVIASRGQQAVREAMEAIRQRAPFRIREIHPDNDSGLVNELLWKYCKDARIQMSRSRPYKKNDNAWIEQRNWTHVRKVVGYQRFDTTGEMQVLRELYRHLRLYKNFFQPAMKLQSKERVGGKIHRKYDQARTPYQRLLESGQLKASVERELRQTYEKLNVAQLRRQIEQLRNQLLALAEQKTSSVPSPRRGKLELSFGGADRRREWYRKRAAGQ